MSTLFVLCFWSALKASVVQFEQEQASAFENGIVQVYRYIPMLSLASMLSYLAIQF